MFLSSRHITKVGPITTYYLYYYSSFLAYFFLSFFLFFSFSPLILVLKIKVYPEGDLQDLTRDLSYLLSPWIPAPN